MKRLVQRLAAGMAAVLVSGAAAAGGYALPYSFAPDVGNLASVQRGARDFMSYCSGCHSMQYLRYNRIASDLGIPLEVMQSTLMFTSEKPGDTIRSALPAAGAETWFGAKPPDLTLETRARGPSWVYSYLMTFHVDDGRPLGVNNLVLAGASMPHVLWELQGWQVKADYHGEGEGQAETGRGGHGTGLELAQPGSLSPEEYGKFVGDLVNFMAYAAEPGAADRVSLGKKAMVYLLVLLVLAYLLKKEYWKDVH